VALQILLVHFTGIGIIPNIPNAATPKTAAIPPNKAVAKQHGLQKQLGRHRIHWMNKENMSTKNLQHEQKLDDLLVVFLITVLLTLLYAG
jgi:hypothetical protein